MGNLFCSSQKKDKMKITPRDRAVLELKIQRDRLKQYQKRIATILERETEIAKAFLRKEDKAMALLTLKKKKYQQGLMESTANQLLNLEQLVSSIEFAQVELQVMEGLKNGNAVLTDLQKEMSLEDVEKLMADTAEAVAYQNEISAMLSSKLTEEDEEDLENELNELQLSMMPEVPNEAPPVEVEKESPHSSPQPIAEQI